jgi:hypothetical protein
MAQFGNAASWSFDPAALVGDSPSYEAVAEIVNIDFGGIAADALDSTVHGNLWRTRTPGLKDAGTVTVGVRFTTTEASHEGVLDAVGVLCAHKFSFPSASGDSDGFVVECDGIVTSAAPSAPHDNLLNLNVTIQLSGVPTVTFETVDGGGDGGGGGGGS